MTEIKSPPKQQDRSPSRLMRGMLIGSLALNLLVVGGGIGLMATAGKHRDPQQASFNLGPFTGALLDDQKEEVRAKLYERMEERRHLDRKDARRMMRALLTAIQQEPFERDAVREIVKDMDAQSQIRRSQGTETLLDAFDAMSHAERLSYVERLEENFTSKRKKKRGSHPPKN
jgi:Spy/CpxP family protein refolding chaperone